MHLFIVRHWKRIERNGVGMNQLTAASPENGNGKKDVAGNADWQVYIVECADNSLYTGIARDLTSRLEEHNAGAGAKYTRSRLPVRLLYKEGHPDRSSASRREATIKHLDRAGKLELIAGNDCRD